MYGRQNMSKYDKMIALNKVTSQEKITLAKNTILEMVEEGVKVTIPKLVTKTGLSRGFFYKNSTIRMLLDDVQEKQIGMKDLKRGILDLAMDNEIEILKEKIRALQMENDTLKSENKRLKQIAERKAMNNFKKL